MKTIKRTLALLLSVLLLFSAVPLTAFADETETPEASTVFETGSTSGFEEPTPMPELTIIPDAAAASTDSMTPSDETEPGITTPAPAEVPEAIETPETSITVGAPDTAVTKAPDATVTLAVPPVPEPVETPEVSAAPESTQEPRLSLEPVPDPVKLEYEVLSDYETGGLFLFPVPDADEITQEYNSNHPAWDIAASEGSPVVAAENGVVTNIQIWNGDATGNMSYGHKIQIKHGDELTTLYAHLSEINVSIGDHIVRGQRIGRVGSTGNATGSHLHLEFITSGGEKVNPDWLLQYGIMPLLSPDLPYATIKAWCNHPNGTRTISDFGVTREAVVSELTAHENDRFYLGTPYQGYDWQSPNGDPSYNGTSKMNCGGFVAYVLNKCGLSSGTANLWTHSASPTGSVQWYMTQNADVTGGAWWDWNGVDAVHSRILMCGAANYPLWVRNADLLAYTYETKAAMLASGVLEKGDVIIMIPKTAATNGFNDSHIGFFWGNSSNEDKMWHSNNAGNRISTIQPKTTDSSYIVVKYGQPTYNITLTKTSANATITNGNPNYSLAGAKYNVYKYNALPNHDYSRDTVLATFMTDANGKANLSKKLENGDYAVIEATAPKGYVLDTTPQKITIRGGNTTMSVVDDPGTIQLTVRKKDSETGVSVPQGNASLAGAVYAITYKENGSDKIVYKTTNASGITLIPLIPLGTVKIQEITAPLGYKLDPTVHTYTVTAEQLTTAVYDLEPNDFHETVIKGKISLEKRAEMLNSTSVPEPGARFEVYLKSSGSYSNAKETERDVLTTGANGTATTKDLPYGTYVVHQVSGGAGRKFVDDFEVSIAEDGRTYAYTVTNKLKNAQLKIIKTSEDGNVSGISFRITRLADGATFTYTTDAAGTILTDALPVFADVSGESLCQYKVEEIDVPAQYIAPEPQIVTLTPGEIAEVRFENRLQEIGTTAAFDDGSKISDPLQAVTLIDTVSYTNLTPGIEYTVSGILMDKTTGNALLIGGEQVTANASFTPEFPDGTVDVTFTFDAALLAGKTIVVFETLRYDGNEVAVHADLTDANQTVEFSTPEIGTTALFDNGSKVNDPMETVTLIDTVSYVNLTPGKEYTVSGILMDKATGEALLIGGEQVTADAAFTPENTYGMVEVAFIFDAQSLKGKTLVVFESLSRDSTELAVHADLEDEEQTVTIHEPSIQTTATDENGDKDITTARSVTIVDVVDYTDLTPGKEYTVSGILMDKAAGNALLIDGEQVISNARFTPESSDGTVVVTFTFDARELRTETEIVVFEALYRGGIKLAVHADLEDEGQTVTISPLHGSVTTTKVNADDLTDKISGAVFGVYADTNANGIYDPDLDTRIGTLDGPETGVYALSDLLYGNYLLHEDNAPEGFVQDVIYYPFTITEDGQLVEFESIPGKMFPNKPIRGSVTTTKVNADDPTDKISGAVFGIYQDVNGNGKLDVEDTRIGSMNEGESGVYILSDLLYGHYLIHEDEAPQGFIQDDLYYPFSIIENGQIVVFETTPGALFPNKPKPPVPQTGDTRNLLPFFASAALALGGLIAVILIRRKKQNT